MYHADSWIDVANRGRDVAGDVNEDVAPREHQGIDQNLLPKRNRGRFAAGIRGYIARGGGSRYARLQEQVASEGLAELFGGFLYVGGQHDPPAAFAWNQSADSVDEI